jgi:hypothetical protein
MTQMFGRKRADSKVANSDYKLLLIHVAYLRELAERLGGTDKEAVLAAASLLDELGQYLRRTGVLS